MVDFHPLFPPSDDDDSDEEPPDIQEIHVQRKENGKYVTAPRTFLAGELLSLAQLHGEFGGGEYQLLGRDSAKRIRRRVVLTLPGSHKPMFDDGPQSPPPPPPPSTNPFMAAMGGGEGGIMGLIMMMMQNMMQQASQASERQTQMMLAMMNNAGQASQAQMIAMQENMRTQAERDQRDKQSQIELMLKLTEARGSGNSTGGEESFFKGVEFMRHFATQQVEMLKATAKNGGEFDWEALLESGMQAFQTFNAFKELSGGGIPGAAAVPPEVVPS